MNGGPLRCPEKLADSPTVSTLVAPRPIPAPRQVSQDCSVSLLNFDLCRRIQLVLSLVNITWIHIFPFSSILQQTCIGQKVSGDCFCNVS